MSLVTRCPACATTFKVVRDQLRISDGWVRCGRCSQVFDATADLLETAEPEPANAPAASPDAAGVAPSDAGARVEETGASTESSADPSMPPVEEDFLDDDDEPEPEPEPEPEKGSPNEVPLVPPTANAVSVDRPSVASFLVDEPWLEHWEPMPSTPEPLVPAYPSLAPFPNIDLSLPAVKPRPEREPVVLAPIRTPGDVANAQFQKALRRARVKSAKIAKSKAREQAKAAAARDAAPMPQLASEAEQPVEQVRRGIGAAGAVEVLASFWHRVSGRRLLWVMVVGAALLLAFQVLHQERDSIVARQPTLRPAFAALCQVTGCELSALRRIGDISIDGSSFAREKTGDAYRLRFRLRSTATLPLAMPAVELSLLDTQERAVVRRVLMPAEFGAPPVLSARGEREASLQLTLTGAEAAALPPVAGYRVEALYP